MVLLLPETKGKTLPETLEDAENMHRYDMEHRPHGAGQLSFASARPGKKNCLVTIFTRLPWCFAASIERLGEGREQRGWRQMDGEKYAGQELKKLEREQLEVVPPSRERPQRAMEMLNPGQSSGALSWGVYRTWPERDGNAAQGRTGRGCL